MAYSTGTYSSLANALDLFRAFLLAQGWTINYSATGELNVSKTINGTARYFNFVTATASNPFTASYDAVTGICLNGSTGWTSGGGLTQPGYTDRDLIYSSSQSTGGCVDECWWARCLSLRRNAVRAVRSRA